MSRVGVASGERTPVARSQQLRESQAGQPANRTPVETHAQHGARTDAPGTPHTCSVTTAGMGSITCPSVGRLADVTAAEDVAAPTIYDLNAPQGKLDSPPFGSPSSGADRVAAGAESSSRPPSCRRSVGSAALLLLGQQGLDVLLEAVTRSSLVDVLPWVLAIPFVAALQLFVSAVQRERQEILGELMTRHVQSRCWRSPRRPTSSRSTHRRSTIVCSGCR